MALLPDPAGTGNRILELLTSHHLTVEAAAARLRFSPAEVEDAVGGNAKLTLLVAIVREFGVDPAWLLTGTYDVGTHQASADDPVRAVQEIMKRMTARPDDRFDSRSL